MRVGLSLAGVLIAALICQETVAQQRTGGTATTGGAFGNRALGGSLSAGTRSFSSGGGARAGGAGSSGNFGVGSAGMVESSDRFVRTARQAGAFVGADAADAREFVGSITAGSATTRGTANIRRGGGGATNANRGGGSRETDSVRISLKTELPVASGETVADSQELAASRLIGRMERSSWIQNRSPLELTFNRGTATLRGVVATEHDRVLAERLVLLEPGISAVKNELQVQSPPPTLIPVATEPSILPD